jgi:TRAP-type C4-dicarboxylate transport system permease small subunit
VKTNGINVFCFRLGSYLEIIAGVALVLAMLLTTADIILRAFGLPIRGAYELVSFSGGLVIMLSIPITSKEKGHVIVDLLIDRVSRRKKLFLHVVTRLMAAAGFFFIGWSLIRMGSEVRSAGQVSSILRLPYYPIIYAMAGASFAESLVLINDLIRFGKGKDE